MSDRTSDTTAIVGDQWTPKTLMDACIHIRSLEAKIRELRSAIMSVQRVSFDAGFNAGQDGDIRALAYKAWSGQQ